MSKKRIILGAVVVVVVGIVAVASLGRNAGDEGVPVEVEKASRRNVTQTVTATGKIQPVTQVKISADVSAKITRLAVDEGDWVDKGDLLLELDRERYEAAVESAEATLRAAQAQIDLARENMLKVQKDYERTRQLFDKDLESEASLDSMYAAAEVEKARYQAAIDQTEQARAALKQARDDLSKTSIYAPMSGTVSKLNAEEGEIAIGSQFQEDVILEISNLAGMEALVDVDENDIVLVSLGDVASIEVDALPDVTFRGEVTEIASSAKIQGQGTTDQKTEFEVKILITDPGTALRPGMTASAEVVTEVCEDCLSIPIQSVAVRTLDQLGQAAKGDTDVEPRFIPDEDGFVDVVWVVSDGRAAARQVETGIQSDTYIEIVEGLAEGDQVVIGSYRAISRDLMDGSTVVVQDSGEAPQSERRG
jgi:HlyD family secretion protein